MSFSVDRIIARAERLAKAGDIEQAASLYGAVLEKFPQNTRAKDGLAVLAKEARSSRAAAGALDKHLGALIALFNEGRHQAVIEQAESLTHAYPQAARLYNILGAANAALGRNEAALSSYAKAVECEPGLAIAHNNLGNVLSALGRAGEALARYDEALRIIPQFAEAHNNAGSALQSLGRYEEAASRFDKAIRLRPDYAEAHHNLGGVLKALGRVDEALESYAQALRINPRFAEAHYSCGVLLAERERFDEAAARYAAALQLKPRHAEAHNGLGMVLQALGRDEEALASYDRALQCRSEFAEAHNNRANALRDLGRYDEAIAAFAKAVSLAPDSDDIWRNYAKTLRGVSFDAYAPDMAAAFTEILKRKTLVDPVQLARPALKLLSLDPQLRAFMASCREGATATQNPETRYEEIAAGLSGAPLLLQLMEAAPLPDLEVEAFLRTLRKALLVHRRSIGAREALAPFQRALALQCFINEFVYGETDEETAALKALEAEIGAWRAPLSDEDVYNIACLASYRPLDAYEWAAGLPDDNRIKPIIDRYVRDAAAVEAVRPTITTLENITDDVSLAVREQYEENPYPRWVSTGLEKRPKSVAAVAAHLKLRLEGIGALSTDALDILVAGCGTGRQAASTARRFRNARVLAVDLSLSSLAYAKWKTAELEIDNVDYLQADILDLARLDRAFDIVECVGVLHHMRDPVAGWRVVADCVKPGGLMKVGLYSETARAHLSELRARLAPAASPRDLRARRDEIIAMDDEAARKVVQSHDFYSASAFRDMMFHACEHRFRLPELKAHIDALGLRFAGFEFESEAIVKAFAEHHPDEHHTDSGAIYDLDRWHEFELANPALFGGMYNFWLQKPAA